MANTVSKSSTGKASTAKPARLSQKNSQQDEIAKLAYKFWVERGYQHGYDQEDWARAEAVVRARTSS